MKFTRQTPRQDKPHHNVTLNNKLHDLTSQKQKQVLLPGAGVFSVSQAANFTLLQQSNTLHSYSFILCTHSKCLVMLLTPNFHWILSAALRLRSGFAVPCAIRSPPLVALTLVRQGAIRWTAGVVRPRSFCDNHIIIVDCSYRYVL